MAARNYSNTAQEASLTGGVTASATSIIVSGVSGFPALTPYTLVIDPDVTGEELVEVTAASGTTLTVTRGVDGTSASAHGSAATVRHVHSARDFAESRAHEAASSGVHGRTGAVVGSTDVQTLTNKNLTDATNTFPTSLVTLTGTQALTNKDLTGVGNVFPSSLVTLTGTQTLTNKTLTKPTVVNDTTGSNPLLVDGIAGTTAFLARFAVAGTNKVVVSSDGDIRGPNITGGSTRTVRPYARISKSASQTLSAGIDTTVTWGVLDEESDAIFGDLPGNRLVAPIAGLYHISTNLQFGVDGSGVRRAILKVNGVTVAGSMNAPSTAVNCHSNVSTTMRLAANDAITVEAVSTAVNMDIIVAATYLQAIWLTP